RKSFVGILGEGHGEIGGAMLPPPAGVWGIPADQLAALPGYGPDVEKNRADARALMQKAGYTADKPVALKVSTRNIPIYRDAAVIVIDQLKKIFFDAELDTVETANWFPKITRKDYQIGVNLTGSAVDDPDQQFYENYVCGSERNYSGYCNKEIDQMVDQQSIETDQDKRKKLVWEIDKKLQLDAARPIILHNDGATCWQPQVKGLTLMVNSSYNGWRMEDVWLDK
ncbi:MAG TPA: ABC transporter substrate-binding protein, partial [Stellaceae bacterium]|nr:ABC transporter substrate-binding protein [Stellaceae bacterium]